MSDADWLSNLLEKGGMAGGGGLVVWVLHRFLSRSDKESEELRASLGRIESKLDDVHIEQRVQSQRITALEKTLEHVQERVNGGLLDHRTKLEVLTERVIKVEAKYAGDDE